jgi:hypothetical protein
VRRGSPTRITPCIRCGSVLSQLVMQPAETYDPTRKRGWVCDGCADVLVTLYKNSDGAKRRRAALDKIAADLLDDHRAALRDGSQWS